jgi:pyruvate dehydrogenase E2 component (dihydrolipoamide acetyltransferase)
MTNHYTVLMPDIGEGVVEGEVVQWLKQVGDSLAQDEPVVVVMTDKATVELPAPKPGKLAKQYIAQGALATKGKPLYDIDLLQEAPAEPTPAKPPTTPSKPPEVTAAPIASRPSARARATPATRKLARDLDVDLHTINGSGAQGQITPADIKQHLVGAQASQDSGVPQLSLPDDERHPLQGIRRLTALRVAASKASIPHFTWCDSADVTHLGQLRTNLQAEATRRGLHLTYTPFFLRALSLTLTQFPEFNATFDRQAQTLVIHKPHHIGIAMKTALGLIVPVLKQVNAMDFEQMVKAYDALRQRAQSNQLKPSDMQEGTITLSNFGTEGGRWATPVIVAPQVAILATARIRAEPVVRGAQIAIRQILNCSWSFDHRVIDGDMAAAFSNAFLHKLENPIEIISS